MNLAVLRISGLLKVMQRCESHPVYAQKDYCKDLWNTLTRILAEDLAAFRGLVPPMLFLFGFTMVFR